MLQHRSKLLSAAISLAIVSYTPLASAQTFTEAFTGGDVSGAFLLRYEGVEQDNALDDANALTLRSTLQYTTENYEGFSATIQAEDVRIVAGVDEYTVGPTGFNPGVYSVIADPETTEVNQGFIQYTNGDLTAKLGRQVLTLDNHRFIGSVAWRQDWQVYDALKVDYSVNDKLDLNYSYLGQRERIFAEAADIDSKDHLLHAAYKSPIGTLVGYAYLLEQDSPIDNSLDTYGLRLTGAEKLGELDATYLAEFATQKSEVGAADFDADYFVLEGGITFSGITTKLGYESLGSDSGSYGFSTPLATLHAFNGWADLFLNTPAQGLTDTYLNFSGKTLGGTWTAVFHDYNAEDSTPGIDDLGSEINLQFVKPLSSTYRVGIKYADYSEGDLTLPDTQKLWLWLQASF
ncbi:major outer membrane protein [Gammaproteobacteria bacterium]|nr:major outer membrane protein [Gammaproteobacteria bacterium]